jgi:ectoine hydroxylase-related dioxygenase (phytanoyl-CoA dioxygenase family)
MRKSQTESEEYAEGAHRDGGFLMHHLPCVMQVKVQFFLTPLHSRRMGNIGFIRKSHLWTGLPDSLPPEQLERDRFVVTASAGDAVLWTNRTLHFVEGNDSGYDRMSVILTYSPIWSRPFDYVAAPEHVLEQFGPLQRLLVGADGREFCRAKYYNPPSDYYRRYISSLTEALGPLSDCFEPAGSLYNFAPGSPTPRLEVIPVT